MYCKAGGNQYSFCNDRALLKDLDSKFDLLIEYYLQRYREFSKEPRPAGWGFCKPRGNSSPLRYELPFLPALPGHPGRSS